MVTDHKPLTAILGPKKGVPPLAAARLQRWALLLSAYQYKIEFRPTQAHANADALSRLPLAKLNPDGYASDPAILNISQMESLPVTAAELWKATAKTQDSEFLFHYTKEGWLMQVEESLRPFWRRRNDLTLEKECVLWGIRVVVLEVLCERLLKELHHDHSGMLRVKTVARARWWPRLDSDVEVLARQCVTCLAVKNAPPPAPLNPWVMPSCPWERVHLDFAGTFQGSMFLIGVDAHSKWPEVHVMPNTTVPRTLDSLRYMFAAYRLPSQIVTDDGPQFYLTGPCCILRNTGIKHLRSAPYHPALNGLAERFIQSFKQSMKVMDKDGLSLNQHVSSFLLPYRCCSMYAIPKTSDTY